MSSWFCDIDWIYSQTRSIKKKVPHAATKRLKPEVPVLRYHRIRNGLASDSKNMKTYSVSPSQFAQQMKALHDNGYQTISPEQL